MHRPPCIRLIALVVALLGTLAAPASSLAHGWLHEHAAHERSEHHREAAGVDREATLAEMAHGVEIGEPEGHHRHGHNAVVAGPATRDVLRLTSAATSAVISARVALRVADAVESPAAAYANYASLARPDPGGTSPPSLRAPPVS